MEVLYEKVFIPAACPYDDSFLAACGSSGSETPAADEQPAEATAAPADSGVEDGLLRAAALYDIKTMDVAQTTDDYMVPMNIFDRLFEVESSLTAPAR
ncbi:MAG: hypothetical protein V8T45_03475 [Oscillospiraceae bacterium]